MVQWKNYKRIYTHRHHPLVCAACGDYRRVELHHIVPVSVSPELMCIDTNIVPLCHTHHFIIGHLSNWNNYNPHVLADINRFRLSRGQSVYNHGKN